MQLFVLTTIYITLFLRRTWNIIIQSIILTFSLFRNHSISLIRLFLHELLRLSVMNILTLNTPRWVTPSLLSFFWFICFVCCFFKSCFVSLTLRWHFSFWLEVFELFFGFFSELIVLTGSIACGVLRWLSFPLGLVFIEVLSGLSLDYFSWTIALHCYTMFNYRIEWLIFHWTSFSSKQLSSLSNPQS